jgi:23S rRNA (guanosine2251-2'-O)-methyltransferase
LGAAVTPGGRRAANSAGADEFILGRNSVLEVLRAGRRSVTRVHVALGVRPTEALAEILRLAKARQIPVVTGPAQEWELDGDRSHGVAAEASAYSYVALEEILQHAAEVRQAPLVLLLDELQDPQNVGTLLRTAEATGVHGVVLPYRRAAGITPAVVRASSGATEHLLVAAENLAQAIERLQREDVHVVGLEPGGAVRPLDEVELVGPLGLVVGSEGAGMRRLVRQRCDVLACLPVGGRIGSLNAAVAGSIALFLAWSRRRVAAEEGVSREARIDAPGKP